MATPSMHGATSNYYCGLGEFADMGFLLHFLRPDDLFLDVGANIGSFSILASGEMGCHSIAFEPACETFTWLRTNIALNDLASRIECHQKAVGSKPGNVRFTTGLDSLNHVVTDGEVVESQTVEVITLDEFPFLRIPQLVKIDTEGYEADVIAGGRKLFANPSVEAIIIEIAQWDRYDSDPVSIFDSLCDLGFIPCRYDPLRRDLSPQPKPYRFISNVGNCLFVRDPESARRRCSGAPAFRILTRIV